MRVLIRRTWLIMRQWLRIVRFLLSRKRCSCTPWHAIEVLHLKGAHEHDCGGWTWDPPCGGCEQCIAQQYWYYRGKSDGK